MRTLWLLSIVALILAVVVSGIKYVPSENQDADRFGIYQIIGNADTVSEATKYLGMPYRDYFKYERGDKTAILVGPVTFRSFFAQHENYPSIEVYGYRWEWDLFPKSILQK